MLHPESTPHFIQHHSKVKIGPNGRVLIPSEVRHKIGISPGDELFLEADEQGIKLRTLQQVIAQAQAFFTEGIPKGLLVSEELIRDRRAEGERE